MADPEAERALLAQVPRELLIGGTWRPSSTGATFAVEDPATAEPLPVDIADATVDDGIAALDAAVDAAAEWARTAPRRRSEILRNAYDILIARSDAFALAMTLEMGKPLADSAGEVTYGAEFFRWFSEEAVRIDGRFTRAPGGDGEIIVTSRPVGPVLLITPWNFPLAMATRKIGPAVAAGCTMVLKPAEETPITALLLADVMAEAGLPDGVLNVITASDPANVVAAIMADERLRKVSFTGSTAVGKHIHAQASANLQRVSLELGGNAPFVVLEDADVDAAIEGAVIAKMRNMGEACTSANRFIVHEAVAAAFTSGLAGRLEAMRLGRGTEPGVAVGPLINADARHNVATLVADALDHGATVATGGSAPSAPGWFYRPTVLANVAEPARVLHEEIFGPVAPVVTVASTDDALARANATQYGLIAYLYTRDVRRALDVAQGLDAGMVGVNRGVVSNPAAPFGGVKQSGLGREGGAEGIWEYLDVQYLGIAN